MMHVMSLQSRCRYCKPHIPARINAHHAAGLACDLQLSLQLHQQIIYRLVAFIGKGRQEVGALLRLGVVSGLLRCCIKGKAPQADGVHAE